jgi:hypothetical protein
VGVVPSRGVNLAPRGEFPLFAPPFIGVCSPPYVNEGVNVPSSKFSSGRSHYITHVEKLASGYVHFLSFLKCEKSEISTTPASAGGRVARFFLIQRTKTGNDLPNDHKIYRLAIIYVCILNDCT